MSPLVYYAGLYAASAALLKAAGFVFFLWLARTLPVGEYAAWGLLYALQTWVASFGLVGILESVVGLLKTNRTAEERRRLFTAANGAFLATASSSILLAALLFLSPVRPESSFVTAACALASGGLLAYAMLQAQIVRLEERHFASLCFNFLIPFSGLIGSFVAFALERTVQSFFVGATLGLGISLAGAMAMRVGFYRLPAGIADCRPILSRVAPFIMVTFLGWLGGYGNTYVVKLFFESGEVAKFTLAFMLSSVMQLVATAMNQVWSPRFYRMIQSLPLDQVEANSRLFFRWQGIALGIVGAIMIGSFPWAADIVGGNLAHYRSLSAELLLLVSAYIVVTPYWHCQNHLLAHDKGSLIMKVHVVTGLVGLFALAMLIWLVGPLGIYIGFLAQMALRSAGALVAARGHWPVTISWGGVVAGLALAVLGFAVSGGAVGR